MSAIKVVQSFQVEINGAVKTFGSETEAKAALARQGFEAEVNAYLESTGIEGKQKVAKANCILDFLSYQAATATEAEAAE